MAIRYGILFLFFAVASIGARAESIVVTSLEEAESAATASAVSTAPSTLFGDSWKGYFEPPPAHGRDTTPSDPSFWDGKKGHYGVVMLTYEGEKWPPRGHNATPSPVPIPAALGFGIMSTLLLAGLGLVQRRGSFAT